MKAKTILLVGVPLLVILGLVGWRVQAKNEAGAELKKGQAAKASAPVPVELFKVQSAVIEDTQDLSGNVESPFMVKLSAQSAGRIDFLEARVGDVVTKGQVLVRLDPSEIQGEILTSRANLAAAQSRLAQAMAAQPGNNTGIASQILKDRAGLESVQANYQQSVQNSEALVAAADSAVTDAQAKVDSATASIGVAQSELESAQANAANAEAKYKRVQNLYQQGFIAAQDVDDARTAQSVAQSAAKVSASKLVAARSALDSAVAQRKSAQLQAAIVRRKVQSDLAASKALVEQAKASVSVSNANTGQVQANAANISALRSGVAAAQGQLSQSQSKLADTVLTSPIDGVITQRTGDPGGTATPGTVLLTVQYLKWLFVTVPVPTEFSQSIKVGDVLPFTVDGLANTYEGKVTQVNPAADPQSRQFIFRLRLEDATGTLKPGMYAHVRFTTRRVAAKLAVPVDALDKSMNGVDGKSQVFVATSGGTVRAVPVEVGARNSTLAEVRGDLQPGDEVVVLAGKALKDGQKISDSAKKGAKK